MRKLRTAVLAGAAALCVAGAAVAASNDTHMMAVSLPDGSVAHIQYKGDVAPKVRIDPILAIAPIGFVDWFDDAPFAAFDRIFADMDRQAATMMRQFQVLQTQPAGNWVKPDLAAFGGMPAGTVSYRFVSTSEGDHVCSRSWQVTSQGGGRQPKLVSVSSVGCDTASPTKAGKTGAIPVQAPTAPRADATMI